MIANICGIDQATEKWKTALRTTIFFTFGKTIKLWSTNEKMTLTLKFNRVLEVVVEVQRYFKLPGVIAPLRLVIRLQLGIELGLGLSGEVLR